MNQRKRRDEKYFDERDDIKNNSHLSSFITVPLPCAIFHLSSFIIYEKRLEKSDEKYLRMCS